MNQAPGKGLAQVWRGKGRQARMSPIPGARPGSRRNDVVRPGGGGKKSLPGPPAQHVQTHRGCGACPGDARGLGAPAEMPERREVRRVRASGPRQQRGVPQPHCTVAPGFLPTGVNHVTCSHLQMLGGMRGADPRTVPPELGLHSCPPAFCHERNTLQAINDPRRRRHLGQTWDSTHSPESSLFRPGQQQPHPSQPTDACARTVTAALAGWLSRLDHHPVHQKVAGSIPGQGTDLGCGFNPWSGHI